MNKYLEIAELFQSLASAKRIQILFLLSNGEMGVSEIIMKMKIRKANVSQNLAILRLMKLVKTRTEGKRIFYKLADSKAINLVRAIQKI